MLSRLLRFLVWPAFGAVIVTAWIVANHLKAPPPATPLQANTIAAIVSSTMSTAQPEQTAPIDNPRVAPGKVRWHSSFAAAQVAAQKSGKPVLLFHMMGQLDRQFC
jgi:hypothetical protein